MSYAKNKHRKRARKVAQLISVPCECGSVPGYTCLLFGLPEVAYKLDGVNSIYAHRSRIRRAFVTGAVSLDEWEREAWEL
jgi:hypothetical protein